MEWFRGLRVDDSSYLRESLLWSVGRLTEVFVITRVFHLMEDFCVPFSICALLLCFGGFIAGLPAAHLVRGVRLRRDVLCSRVPVLALLRASSLFFWLLVLRYLDPPRFIFLYFLSDFSMSFLSRLSLRSATSSSSPSSISSISSVKSPTAAGTSGEKDDSSSPNPPPPMMLMTETSTSLPTTTTTTTNPTSIGSTTETPTTTSSSTSSSSAAHLRWVLVSLVFVGIAVVFLLLSFHSQIPSSSGSPSAVSSDSEDSSSSTTKTSFWFSSTTTKSNWSWSWQDVLLPGSWSDIFRCCLMIPVVAIAIFSDCWYSKCERKRKANWGEHDDSGIDGGVDDEIGTDGSGSASSSSSQRTVSSWWVYGLACLVLLVAVVIHVLWIFHSAGASASHSRSRSRFRGDSGISSNSDALPDEASGSFRHGHGHEPDTIISDDDEVADSLLWVSMGLLQWFRIVVYGVLFVCTPEFARCVIEGTRDKRIVVAVGGGLLDGERRRGRRGRRRRNGRRGRRDFDAHDDAELLEELEEEVELEPDDVELSLLPGIEDNQPIDIRGSSASLSGSTSPSPTIDVQMLVSVVLAQLFNLDRLNVLSLMPPLCMLVSLALFRPRIATSLVPLCCGSAAGAGSGAGGLSSGSFSSQQLQQGGGERTLSVTSLRTGFSSTLRQIFQHKDTRDLFLFLLLNVVFMIMEVFYGFYSNSLGLIGDSVHMLFDCSALSVGLYGNFMKKWKRNAKYTYGYGRFETMSAFVNGCLLVFTAILVFLEALKRLLDPPDIYTNQLLLVSVIGLVVNLIGVVFFMRQEQTADTYAVVLHMIADTLGSVGVITSTLLIMYYDALIADPICSFLISFIILFSSSSLLKESMAVMLQAVPPGMEINALKAKIEGLSYSPDDRDGRMNVPSPLIESSPSLSPGMGVSQLQESFSHVGGGDEIGSTASGGVRVSVSRIHAWSLNLSESVVTVCAEFEMDERERQQQRDRVEMDFDKEDVSRTHQLVLSRISELLEGMGIKETCIEVSLKKEN